MAVNVASFVNIILKILNEAKVSNEIMYHCETENCARLEFMLKFTKKMISQLFIG